jgi:hypothetical protein
MTIVDRNDKSTGLKGYRPLGSPSEKLISVSLCDLCASVVSVLSSNLTTETQRFSQRHRETRFTDRLLRGLCLSVALLASFCTSAFPVFAQANQSAASPSQSKPVVVDPNKYALIINGASGEPAYGKQFDTWTTSLRKALLGRFGFAKDRVKLLTEKPPDSTAAPATAEEVKKAFASLRTELTADNVLFVFLIGHGSFDKEAKFNLVGPDLSANDYNTMLTALPTRRVIVFNLASASGEFIKPLAAKGRIVVTATRSGQETNATRFTEYLLVAMLAADSDTDQDGHISVLEAFNYANRLTAEFYARAGRLATEHALLEDNGDGVGHQKLEGGDGMLARATYLDSLSVEQAATNATIAKLLRDRTRLEGEIGQLIARKKDFAEAEYEAQLEKLFIELAKVNRAIKQGAASPTE